MMRKLLQQAKALFKPQDALTPEWFMTFDQHLLERLYDHSVGSLLRPTDQDDLDTPTHNAYEHLPDPRRPADKP